MTTGLQVCFMLQAVLSTIVFGTVSCTKILDDMLQGARQTPSGDFHQSPRMKNTIWAGFSCLSTELVTCQIQAAEIHFSLLSRHTAIATTISFSAFAQFQTST